MAAFFNSDKSNPMSTAIVPVSCLASTARAAAVVDATTVAEDETGI